MLGAIAGDVIGSIYEHRPIKTTRFPLLHPLCRYTDDTVLTVALADSILHGTGFVGLMKPYHGAGESLLSMSTIAFQSPSIFFQTTRYLPRSCPRPRGPS